MFECALPRARCGSISFAWPKEMNERLSTGMYLCLLAQGSAKQTKAMNAVVTLRFPASCINPREIPPCISRSRLLNPPLTPCAFSSTTARAKLATLKQVVRVIRCLTRCSDRIMTGHFLLSPMWLKHRTVGIRQVRGIGRGFPAGGAHGTPYNHRHVGAILPIANFNLVRDR